MNKYVKLTLFGIFIWVITFLVSFVIYPLRGSNRPLFESIMPVTLTIVVVVFSFLYFIKTESTSLHEGIMVGVLWFFISLVIDLILFLPPSPMHMSFPDYMSDIGFTYLIIPTITIGFSCILEKTKK